MLKEEIHIFIGFDGAS